jgi:16S rRNA (guanine966-N2)-methyltransferase
MRILGGEYKGMKIKSSSKCKYRPTKSVVRKSIFDSLGPLNGCHVLDLFAGTGILGFEAMSRGAESITFIEKNYQAIQLLKTNTRLLSEGTFKVIRMDAVKYLKQTNVYHLILADPPYNYFTNGSEINVDFMIDLILDSLNSKGRFILECSQNIKLNYATKSKIFGNTKVCLGEKK